MSLFDRMSRLVKATVNEQRNRRLDPEQELEQIVAKLQVDLVDLRQTVAQAIAMQKRTERQSHQASTQAGEWYKRAQAAVNQGNDELAHDALTRRHSYLSTAESMQTQVQQQSQLVVQLKQNLRDLESKVLELKTKKDFYIARARSAQASIQISDLMDTTGTSQVMQAFDRMEEQVMTLEARAELEKELSDNQLEKRFEALGEADEIEAELRALKAGKG